MFEYCGNNPIDCSDFSGCRPKDIQDEINPTQIDDSRITINGQQRDPYSSMSYGTGNVGDSGCVVIATYNALLLSGYSTSFTSVVDYYVWRWIFLHHGTPTWLIGGCLSTFGVEYVHSCDPSIIGKCKNGGTVIVNVYNRRTTISYCTVPGMGHEKSLWTTAVVPDWSSGRHAVAITYENGKYMVYNYRNYRSNPMGYVDYWSYLDEGWFLDAYYVYPNQ